MVLGTVPATNAASQQLRLDYIKTKPLRQASSKKATACHPGQGSLVVVEPVAAVAALTSAVGDPLRGPFRLAVSLAGLS